MNFKFPSFFKISISSMILSLALTSPLLATEDRLSSEVLYQIEKERISQMPEDILEQITPQFNYRIEDAYLDRIHKLAYNFPLNLVNGGQKLQLIDESIWTVNPLQSNRVRQWIQEHILFIKPTASCFSRYPYVLYNRNTYEAIEVQFVDMPRHYNMYRQKIEKIDGYNRLVQLDDAERTVWQVSLSDSGFNRWSIGDYIIVGVNNDWRMAKHPHILINTSITYTPYCEASYAGNAL